MPDASIRTSDERVDLAMISRALQTVADHWPLSIDTDQAGNTRLYCQHCQQSTISLGSRKGSYTITRADINTAIIAHMIHAHRYEMDGTSRDS